MANIICVFVLTVAVFGNVAFGNPRQRRSGITVVSGVDQNGQEYGGIFRHPDGEPGLYNRFGDEDNEAVPQIPEFIQNLAAPPDFGHTLNNYINLLFKMFREQFQNNLAVQQQTNRIAIDAANTISNRVGFPFQYTPPGPDFAYATGQIAPFDTYVKTEINDPNRYQDSYIFDRFQDDESKDQPKQKKEDSASTTNKTKDNDSPKEPPANTNKNSDESVIFDRFQDDDTSEDEPKQKKEGSTNTNDNSKDKVSPDEPSASTNKTSDSTTSTTQKPLTRPKWMPILPQSPILTFNKVVPSDTSLNNRFSEDDGNADIKTIVSSTADGKPVYRTTVITRKGSDAALGNRFSADGDDDSKLESVQTFLTTDAEGKPLYETMVFTSKAEPSLNSRFSGSDDEDPQKDHSVRTFVTSLDGNKNTTVSDDGTHAEIITNKNGTIRRIVTKTI